MGLPLKSYLTQILVQMARELIGSTDISIQQVAYELGYDDPYYFSRAFKKAPRKTIRAGIYEPSAARGKERGQRWLTRRSGRPVRDT